MRLPPEQLSAYPQWSSAASHRQGYTSDNCDDNDNIELPVALCQYDRNFDPVIQELRHAEQLQKESDRKEVLALQNKLDEITTERIRAERDNLSRQFSDDEAFPSLAVNDDNNSPSADCEDWEFVNDNNNNGNYLSFGNDNHNNSNVNHISVPLKCNDFDCSVQSELNPDVWLSQSAWNQWGNSNNLFTATDGLDTDVSQYGRVDVGPTLDQRWPNDYSTEEQSLLRKIDELLLDTGIKTNAERYPLPPRRSVEENKSFPLTPAAQHNVLVEHELLMKAIDRELSDMHFLSK